MKVVLINNLYGQYARGGAERIAEAVADGLVKTGHDVVVVGTQPKEVRSKTQILNTKYQILTFYPWNLIAYCNLHKLPKILRLPWHIINMFNVQSYFQIKKILQKEKPDIVMTHNLMGVGFLTPRAIKNLNIKLIHTLHDIQLLHPSGLMLVGQEKKVDSLVAKLYQWFNKKLFASVDVVVSPSQWLLDEHLKRGFFENAKKVVMGNPTNAKCRMQNAEFKNSENFIFLYVGQIEKHKGVELLIHAFADLKSNKCELLIAGDGAESKKLEVRSKNIKFLGRKNQDEVQSLMRQVNCLVVPSLCYENQPTVIIEAMQNGLPVIASNLGGIPEMLNSEFLFQAGNRESLKNKMQWMMNGYQNLPVSPHPFFPAKDYIEKLLEL
jgi:glycosyltransferase involved in cell wall biosynthesis